MIQYIFFSTFSARLSLIFQDRPERDAIGSEEVSSGSREGSSSRSVPNPLVGRTGPFARLTDDDLHSGSEHGGYAGANMVSFFPSDTSGTLSSGSYQN